MEQGSDGRLIVLDDDPVVEKLIQGVIKQPSRAFVSVNNLLASLEEIEPIGFFVDVHIGESENGLEVIPQLKERWPFSPIIVLTSDRTGDYVAEALAFGADDFVNKPINASEIVARFQTRLDELSKREAREIIKVGDLVIDTSHRVINGEHGQRYLSPTELSMLVCLINARGTVVKREFMKRKCWGQIHVSDNALNRKLHEVRRTLQEISSQVRIRTVYGTGFSLEAKARRASRFV